MTRNLANLYGLRCLLMLCPHQTVFDDPEAIYGECLQCGKRAGEVSREEVRRYLDREANR